MMCAGMRDPARSPRAQAQLGELCDPRFGDRDDDAEPVLAGESLGEEHGACLCRGCGGSDCTGCRGGFDEAVALEGCEGVHVALWK